MAGFVLNRRCHISGRSTQTRARPETWAYATYQPGLALNADNQLGALTDLPDESWAMPTHPGHVFSPPSLPFRLSEIGPVIIWARRAVGESYADPDALTAEQGIDYDGDEPEEQIFVYAVGADGYVLASYPATSFFSVKVDRQTVGGGAIIGAPSLTGQDVEIASPGALTLGFSAYEDLESVTTNVSKAAWCRIEERGAERSLIDLAAAGEEGIEIRETAEFITRYDPALTIGSSVQDDLNRRWTVESSHTMGNDRRFMSFETYRIVEREIVD